MKTIRKRFQANLKRVLSLVRLYRMLVGLRVRWQKKDGPAVVHGDLLRAAVVLLHAALEDVLRATEERLLPNRPEVVLKSVPIPLPLEASKTVPHVHLGQLTQFRGQSVDEVIRQAIEAHLDRQSYNNIVELDNFLRRMDFKLELPDDEKRWLMAMMKRRHLIAHRADRDPERGDRHHRLTAIEPATVQKWHDAVKSFGEKVLTCAELQGGDDATGR